MKYRRWAVVVFWAGLGCKSNAPASTAALPAPSATPSPTLLAAHKAIEEILPDAALPFTAVTPVHYEKGYVRRTYAAGDERIAITIARYGQDPNTFERWVAESASYPQAQLSLPPALANGYFTCASELADAPCDLHIQLRAGFHVEVMGNGHVPRRDLAKLMTHVPLGELSDATSAAL